MNSFVQEGILKRKLNQFVQWYEETTGMDEVRMSQNRVLEAEEKFISAQDRRRESNKEVTAVQNKLKDLYAELDNTARGEERYVALITEEHKLLKQEKQVMNEFKRYEREEREYFSALSSAVKESHEKERAQAERTKYWSIIGSIIGTIIGIVGSSINNEIRMKELRKLITDSTIDSKINNNSAASPELFLRYERELNAITNEMNVSLKHNVDVVNRLNNVISLLDNRVRSNQNLNSDSVLNTLSQQQIVLEKNLKELKAIIELQIPNNISKDDNLAYPYSTSSQDKNETAKMLFLSTVVVAFPIIFHYFNLFS
ncbi:Uncharacterized protein GBIM_09935 [Gryllus bimaculatus]|nr:Uncharacterized protein GBIM_09935 [Gryllus bimaculatus]